MPCGRTGFSEERVQTGSRLHSGNLAVQKALSGCCAAVFQLPKNNPAHTSSRASREVATHAGYAEQDTEV